MYAATRKKPWNTSEYGSTTKPPPHIVRVVPSTANVITGIIAASTPNEAICSVLNRPRYWKKKSAISTTTIVADTMMIGAIAWKSQPGFTSAPERPRDEVGDVGGARVG